MSDRHQALTTDPAVADGALAGRSAAAPLPRLLGALARVSAAYPLERKLLVCRSPAEGRELLHALARCGTPWIGWEPISLRQFALDLVAPALAVEQTGLADEFDVLRLLDEAVDSVGARGGSFARALAAPGFRAAAHRAVQSLRAAGVGVEELRAESAGPAEALLAEVLAAYEAGLGAAQLEDGAGVIRRAADLLETGVALLPRCRLFLVPGLERSGAPGRLLRHLLHSGAAEVLEADAVVGVAAPAALLWREGAPAARLSWLHAPEQAPDELSTPEIELFAAATPADELREVLRRVMERGLAWDEVEIIATDAFTYGPALDSLGQRLGIAVTHAAGLSSQRTRVGRAVAAYFTWVAEGFPAERLAALLETGDLAPPEEFGTSGPALAARLRRLGVGWGRERYLPAIERALQALAEPPARENERDPEQEAAERERAQRQLRALRAMLAPVLAATPAAPDRLRTQHVATTPAALAEGLLAFLRFVPPGGKVENTTRGEIRRRLERARATLTRLTGWDAAVATLRSRLELQVAAEAEGSSAAWVSAGGALHHSDLRTGGLTARRHTFIVGLDATRAAAAGAADPLLSDAVRRRINRDAGGEDPLLPTAAERLAMGRYALAALLARLRGVVTLSYSAWDAAEGRAVSPAAELLQALRLRERNPLLAYDELHQTLGALACAVPAGRSCLDATDVWMQALAAGRVLRDGEALVREAFAGLDRGLVAQERRGAPELTEYHGVVDPESVRPLIEAMRFSPSRLETLGSCPRRFFYRYVLKLQPPETTEWDAEVWLDAAARGSLLHAVYERALREAREQAVPLTDAVAFGALSLEILSEEAVKLRHHLPAPSDRIFAEELAALEADVAVFVAMIAADPPAWRELEWEFGGEGREVSLRVNGTEIRLQGKIDRVDDLRPGVLRVVDYKSGGARRYRENAPFDGGRRIQHWLYQVAAEQALGARETTMEYHFPTVKGEARAVRYPRERLGQGGEVLGAMLGLATEGLFLASDQETDCAYCDFAAVCRVSKSSFGKASCAATEWSRKIGMELAEYAPLKTLREIDANDD